jgi:hypothetical protein
MSDINSSQPRKPKRVGLSQAILGAILNLVGLAFAFSPFFLAVIAAAASGGNPLSEGGGGTGAVMWLMILTLPLGAVVSVVGLVFMLIGIIYTLRVKLPAEGDAKRAEVLGNRAIAFALVALPLLLTQPILSFVLGNMIIGPSAALVTIFTISALIAVTAVLALYFGIKSQKPKLRVIILIASVISVGLAIYLGQLWYQLFTSMNSY